MEDNLSYGAWTTIYYIIDLNTQRKRADSYANVIELCKEYEDACREATTSGADNLLAFAIEAENYMRKCQQEKVPFSVLKQNSKNIGAPTPEDEK